MNSIRDILKDSIDQMGLVEQLTPAHILVSFVVALICAGVIYTVYKLFHRGAVYNENFNVLLVITSLTTAFIIMTISSNLVLSLGMVGALSIVRFRAAIKDPLDIGFLFFAISAGLTAGAGLYHVAIIGTVAIALIYIAFTLFAKGKRSFLLVVKYDDSAVEKLNEAVKSVKGIFKSRSKYKGQNELTLQVKISKNNTSIVDTISAIEGVSSAVLIEYTGD